MTQDLTADQQAAIEAVMRAFANQGGALVVTTAGYALKAANETAMHAILGNAAEQASLIHRGIVSREAKKDGDSEPSRLVVARQVPGVPPMKAT